MDENSPVFENFLNKMRGSRPIRESRQKISAEKLVGRPEPKTTKVSPSSLLDINEKISEMTKLVVSIASTLKAQEKLDLEILKIQKIESETKRRKKRESFLERGKKKIKGIFSEKVIKPITSLFESVFDFFRNLILGRALVMLSDFLLKPEKVETVTGMLKFLGENLPAIVKTLGFLGTVIGGLILFTTTRYIPAMLAGIFKMLLNPKVLGLSLAAGVGLQGIKMIANPEQAVNKDEVNLNINQNDNTEDINLNQNTTNKIRNNNNQTNNNNFQGNQKINPVQFAGGGSVPGTGNKDNVPALLTPGEFVMSKGAVNKFGEGALASMNSMGGGTNIPTMTGGGGRTLMMAGGGMINNNPKFFSQDNVAIINPPTVMSSEEPIQDPAPFNIKGNSTEKPIKSIQQIASITITGGSREKMETLGITV
tara:strand:+ start:1661 stop:2932 length:1272 start_codon:yes stop_codon:yes gene_type:complete